MKPLVPRTGNELREHPEGGFVAGESWFYFAFDRTLFGYAIWGRPRGDDIRALVRLMELELDRPPHAALVDLGGLEEIASEGFELLASYAVTHQATLARVVTETAIVRPAGVNGAIVSGFFEVSARPFPVTLWTSVEAAAHHLGRSDAAECATALAAARAHVTGEPVLLAELRAYVREHLVAPSIADAARALAVAPRTLQRRLTESRTSFQVEVQRVRLATAEGRLAESETPVTTIAFDLGFASPQHFATLFKKHAGESPTEYRARRRGA